MTILLVSLSVSSKLNDIAQAAVKVEGGARNVDYALVISFLEDILADLWRLEINR